MSAETVIHRRKFDSGTPCEARCYIGRDGIVLFCDGKLGHVGDHSVYLTWKTDGEERL